MGFLFFLVLASTMVWGVHRITNPPAQRLAPVRTRLDEARRLVERRR